MLVSLMSFTSLLFTLLAAIDLDFSALDTLSVQLEVRGQLRTLPPGDRELSRFDDRLLALIFGRHRRTCGQNERHKPHCKDQSFGLCDSLFHIEQIFYAEFDGRRKKRVLIKIIGE